jgi:tetratricopeptide (TPR) repeat protein
MNPLEDLLNELSKESDTRRRAELCQRALSLVARHENPLLWAELQVELGNGLSQDPSGERADNIERALEHYGAALTVYTREAFPADWARAQTNLGLAYSDRICGERADNLERAIAHYQEALTVYTP